MGVHAQATVVKHTVVRVTAVNRALTVVNLSGLPKNFADVKQASKAVTVVNTRVVSLFSLVIGLP
jgi:hypothetical protein